MTKRKREYDFSKSVRGKFYRKATELRLPIYLDAKLQKQVERLAQKNGKGIGETVNQLVQKEVDLIEEFSWAITNSLHTGIDT
jgi:hypothetical protein